MKMGGSDERQEGNYASFDPSMSGRLLLQNDLGLTLLPGSQIEKTGECLRKAVTKTDHHNASEIGECINISVKDLESQRSEDPWSLYLERRCEAGTTALEQSHCKGQSATWGDGKGGAIAGDRSRPLALQESPSDQQNVSHSLVNDRPRYSQKVWSLRNPAPEAKARPKSRTGKPQPRNVNGEHHASRLSPHGANFSIPDGKSTSPELSPLNDRRALPTPSRVSISQSSIASSSLMSTTSARRVRFSTSVYPRCSKRRLSPTINPGLNNSPPPKSPNSTNARSGVQVSKDTTHTQSINLLQAELKKTRQDLFQKTRADSDAKHAIYDLSKAYDGLSATVNAHLEIQKRHTQLLEEHRRLLKSYDSLAKAHAACRSTSSRKLARRIIDAAPPPKQAANPYPSPSPSITAHARYTGSYSNPNATVGSPLPATPLIDLTRSPSPTSAPALHSGGTKPALFIEQGDQIGDGNEPNYMNMNGFDEEADEMFDALWESEMVDFSVEDGKTDEL